MKPRLFSPLPAGILMFIVAGLIHAQDKAADKPADKPADQPADTPAPKPPAIVVEVDTSGVPEMKEWTEKAAQVAVDFYPRILQELGEEGYKKPDKVHIFVKPDMKGVAYASGNTITLAPGWFKANPHDVGAVVHEMCHVVQAYRGRGNPGWVVEGVADYVRWFVFEPVNKRPRVRNPDRAKHTDSYQTTAAFFDWIVRTHDKDFVKKLNLACRSGKYSEELFKTCTKKTVEELWVDFIADVKKQQTRPARPATLPTPKQEPATQKKAE